MKVTRDIFYVNNRPLLPYQLIILHDKVDCFFEEPYELLVFVFFAALIAINGPKVGVRLTS